MVDLSFVPIGFGGNGVSIMVEYISMDLDKWWHTHVHMFTHTDDMIERNSVHVTLHDVDATALRQLVDYTYTGEVVITEDNVQV